MLTVDGIEKHIAVNHLAHFLFITQLLPKLQLVAEKSNFHGAARIVSLTSTAMIASPVRFADYNFDGKPLPDEEMTNLAPFKAILGIEELGVGGYEPTVAYGQSKTANVLFAVHFNAILASHGIYAFAVHPRIVNSTGAEKIYSAFSDKKKAAMAAFGILKTIDQGCATTIVAALDAGLTPKSGVYLADCQIAEAPVAWATNKEKAERLWKLSEELIGGKVSL